ncbi:hypothetical protein HK097_000728 [Rhizophlyctis rosea]|uniref:Uncharacterized protein n=1 Tax=Rhizophlyctis rosea TaxID=64517 RepID=A0AAD5S844_9FUNG|nr:hypothetical protein HK097_000728 [Rhizophlyctis rosea]
MLPFSTHALRRSPITDIPVDYQQPYRLTDPLLVVTVAACVANLEVTRALVGKGANVKRATAISCLDSADNEKVYVLEGDNGPAFDRPSCKGLHHFSRSVEEVRSVPMAQYFASLGAKLSDDALVREPEKWTADIVEVFATSGNGEY